MAELTSRKYGRTSTEMSIGVRVQRTESKNKEHIFFHSKYLLRALRTGEILKKCVTKEEYYGRVLKLIMGEM